MENLSIIGRLQRGTQPAARRRRSATQSNQKCAKHTGGNGFLKHQFTPCWGIELNDWKKTEADFLDSLAHLCNLYQFQTPAVAQLAFPQNVAVAFKEVQTLLTTHKLDCIIARDKNRKATLATVKTFSTGYSLYYIPVRPVWELMKDGNSQPLVTVISCVFNYLYQVIGVGFYDTNSYMSNTYDTLQNWIAEETDIDDEHRQKQQQELTLLKEAGNAIRSVIRQPFDGDRLSEAIEVYQRCPAYDEVWGCIGHCFLQLWKDFPGRSIHSSLSNDLATEEEQDRVYLEQYLSFFWSSEDCLYDDLIEMINGDLQEMCYQDEPVALQWFDKPQEKELHCFDFETRLFKGIEELIQQLNNYEYGKHQPSV